MKPLRHSPRSIHKILKLDDRIGSIKIGKDADFVICTKNILDIQNKIKTVYVNGKKEA